jgi:small-conductance mechanosensitive channel
VNESVKPLQEQLLAAWGNVLDYLQSPWLLYQLGIIVVIAVAARIMAPWLEHTLRARARQIQGQPRLLRLVALVIRRTHWLLFIALAYLASSGIAAVTWPSRRHLIALAASLALAWLTISILSRVIRSRLIARIVAMGVWSYIAVQMLGVEEDVSGILGELGFAIGDMRITVLMLLKSAVLLSISLWLAITVGSFFDERIQRSDELTPSLRVLLGKVVKIALTIIAVAAALSAVGIDLTVFTVFSGAVGVGVGFGLQKVVSNFISGVIILLDRSIKPGDVITVGETFGWIRELRARFVSVVTRDGREFLIPNEVFITTEVVNWSFSDELVRLDVPFGVSYTSDPHVVTALAIQAAASVDRVYASPAPVCWLTGFGDSSLDFLLRFWINDPQNGLTNIRGKVLLALWDSFKEHGVQIPYPHREVILRSPLAGAQAPASPEG